MLRHQLAQIQVQIQSLQQATTPIMVEPNRQSLPPPAPLVTSHAPLVRAIDSKSPLSEGLQTPPWPAKHKPITLPRYNGKSDPRQFIMSFEAAIASVGGNDAVLAKSFVIAAEGNALAWYSMLRPNSIYSWENLRDQILANFKGFNAESLTSADMFSCKQRKDESLKDYFQRFVQLKAKAPHVHEEVAIEAAIKGLYIGQLSSHLAREKPGPLMICTKNSRSTADQTQISGNGSKRKTNTSKAWQVKGPRLEQ